MPASKTVNYEDGSDARYDTSQMWATGDGRLTDGAYFYDSEGRPLDAIPGGNEWTAGLPGARGGTGPGGVGTSGGGGSGLLSSALGSPYYQQVVAANSAAEASDAAFRKQAIQQMLIQFGLVPANFNDQYGDVDQTTRDLATANTSSGISAAARLQQALSDANSKSSKDLAARGLRRSGARGYQLRRNQLGYDQSYSDAIQQLLSGAASTYQGYAQGSYNRQLSLAQALQNAISNMSNYTQFRSASASPPAVSAPQYTPQSAQQYWQSDPAPTYTSPTTGQNWYGGFGGLESTPFKGKAEDGLF